MLTSIDERSTESSYDKRHGIWNESNAASRLANWIQISLFLSYNLDDLPLSTRNSWCSIKQADISLLIIATFRAIRSYLQEGTLTEHNFLVKYRHGSSSITSVCWYKSDCNDVSKLLLNYCSTIPASHTIRIHMLWLGLVCFDVYRFDNKLSLHTKYIIEFCFSLLFHCSGALIFTFPF